MPPAPKIRKDARVLLQNARIVDVRAGRYYPANTSLLIADGRIAAMPGLPGEPRYVHVDLTVDLRGKAVIPGLFNTHCHIQVKYPTVLPNLSDIQRARKYRARQIEKSMADCLENGVTHIRDALTVDLRSNRDLRARIQRGDLPGPRIHQCVLIATEGGVHSSRPGPLQRLVQSVSDVETLDFEQPASAIIAVSPNASKQMLRDAVDRAIDERGADHIKFYDQLEFIPSYKPGASVLSERQLRAAADQTRRRGVPSTMHHSTVASFRRGLWAGVTSLAHLPRDRALTDTDVRAFLDAGCILEPTLTVAYYLFWDTPGSILWGTPYGARINRFRAKTYDELADRYWIPELAHSLKQMYLKASRGRTRALGLLNMAHLFQYWKRVGSQGIQNLQRLHAAGANLACGTDAGAVPATEGMVQHELALFDLCLNTRDAPARFTAADALRLATLDSARALGLEQHFGVIEAGKVADLVVLDGDPLADPTCIGSRAAAVWLDGRCVVNEGAFCGVCSVEHGTALVS